MILIADSGGSKTSWAFVKGSEHTLFKSEGMNPYYKNVEELTRVVRGLPDKGVPASIHFYGAGCSSTESKDRVSQAISSIFPKSEIEVEHDLLGAARSLCQNEAGFVGILGTGSNSCFYDGKSVQKNVPSLGFILGDEGGGSHMGKELVRDFTRGVLPEELHQLLVNQGHSKSSIEHQVYQTNNPIGFLASFASLVKEYESHAYMASLIQKVLDKFVSECLFRYEHLTLYPIHFTGSIAFYFSDQLKTCLDSHGLKVGSITREPMGGLITYHQQINSESN